MAPWISGGKGASFSPDLNGIIFSGFLPRLALPLLFPTLVEGISPLWVLYSFSHQMAFISLFPPSALSCMRHVRMVEGGKSLQEGEGRCKDIGNQVQTKGRTSQTSGQSRWLEGIRETGWW